MRILPPLRPDDLSNSYASAPLAVLEEIRAVDRLPLSAITPHDSGTFTFRLNSSSRFIQWWLERTGARRLFQFDAVECDRFGTHFLLSRPLDDITTTLCGAVCPWTAIPQAAQILRTQYIGPAFWQAHSASDHLLNRYVSDIIQELGFIEQPLNSHELPAVCQLKWGPLLRLGPNDPEPALDYLAIEKPPDSSAPFKTDLGANCFAIAARSPSDKEPLRIGLASAWNDDLAIKDLTRWLRGFEAKAKSDHPLTTAS